MSDDQVRDEIFNVVWKACDTFRGVIDPTQYKDYILTMLFLKYLSDIRKSKLAEYEKKYAGNKDAKVRVERDMARERFTIAEDCTFGSPTPTAATLRSARPSTPSWRRSRTPTKPNSTTSFGTSTSTARPTSASPANATNA